MAPSEAQEDCHCLNVSREIHGHRGASWKVTLGAVPDLIPLPDAATHARILDELRAHRAPVHSMMLNGQILP